MSIPLGTRVRYIGSADGLHGAIGVVKGREAPNGDIRYIVALGSMMCSARATDLEDYPTLPERAWVTLRGFVTGGLIFVNGAGTEVVDVTEPHVGDYVAVGDAVGKITRIGDGRDADKFDVDGVPTRVVDCRLLSADEAIDRRKSDAKAEAVAKIKELLTADEVTAVAGSMRAGANEYVH